MKVTKEMYDIELQAQYGQFLTLININKKKWGRRILDKLARLTSKGNKVKGVVNETQYISSRTITNHKIRTRIYRPQGVKKTLPVMVHFHGGAWIGGTKEAINNDRFHGAINGLREKGFVVISPNYTLAESGKSPFPKCIEDALDVMKWVEEHAEEHKLDLENVGLMGESAGAHLAMMAAYANGKEFGISYSYPINYLVDVYGPVDLKALYTDSEIRKELEARIQNFPAPIKKGLDLSQYLFGFDPQSDTTKAWDFAGKHSPISYFEADAPPLLMIHGAHLASPRVRPPSIPPGVPPLVP